MMSSRIRSGACSRARASAASPSWAVSVSYPWAASRARRMSRLTALSSTIRMRAGDLMATAAGALRVAGAVGAAGGGGRNPRTVASSARGLNGLVT